MSQIIGRQSLQFDHKPYIMGSANIVGKREGDGPLGRCFDVIGEDDKFGAKTWEESESVLQKEAVIMALGKAKVKPEEVRYIFAGDLLGQSIATTFGIMDLSIPFFGLFGACSTSGEALSLAAMTVSAGYAERAVAVTSSHFASAEKQFRFPLAYANQRPLSTTWTVTGGGAFVVGTEKSKVCISGLTTGKIVDYGIKDSMNMGAAMAPAACDTIFQNLKDFNRKPEDYDKIVTGDLGYIGQKILLDLLADRGINLGDRHMDCGIEIFERDTQDTHSGGSGCGCAAVTLSAYILPRILDGTYQRVLFVPTGALMSTVSFNEGLTIPGIAQGVIIEHVS